MKIKWGRAVSGWDVGAGSRESATQRHREGWAEGGKAPAEGLSTQGLGEEEERGRGRKEKPGISDVKAKTLRDRDSKTCFPGV